jgi:serine/threonine protein kinase
LPYLAPEQADLDTYVDDHVDIYRLGAIVYTLLTGRPPFQGQTPEETLELIQHGKIKSPRRRQKDIPEEFERIVLKMLARHQENRYLSARELLADLNPLAEEVG